MRKDELREFVWLRCEADDTKTDEIMEQIEAQRQKDSKSKTVIKALSKALEQIKENDNA